MLPSFGFRDDTRPASYGIALDRGCVVAERKRCRARSLMRSVCSPPGHSMIRRPRGCTVKRSLTLLLRQKMATVLEMRVSPLQINVSSHRFVQNPNSPPHHATFCNGGHAFGVIIAAPYIRIAFILVRLPYIGCTLTQAEVTTRLPREFFGGRCFASDWNKAEYWSLSKVFNILLYNR